LRKRKRIIRSSWGRGRRIIRRSRGREREDSQTLGQKKEECSKIGAQKRTSTTKLVGGTIIRAQAQEKNKTRTAGKWGRKNKIIENKTDQGFGMRRPKD
jgi:1,6-anhydro-N-acetylmuramate kinase